MSIAALAQKFRVVWPLLDERTRRIMAANEAIGLGYGGVSLGKGSVPQMHILSSASIERFVEAESVLD